MKIFDITLPSDDCASRERLYYRASKGAVANSGSIRLSKGEILSLDTYFNILSCKYFKYTVIDILDVSLKFKGEIIFSVFLRTPDGDRLLAKQTSSAQDIGRVSISLRCDAMPEVGYIFIEIESLGDGVEIYGGEFSSDVPVRPVKAGVVICTYKREQFVYDNMRRLQEYIDKTPFFCNKAGIFVIDNGRSVQPQYLPPQVKLVPNDNTGGAGGFTAGIKLVADSCEYTHFILMDDDIAFEPEIVDRTVSLLAILRQEYKEACIGGAMLLKDDPCVLHELGGKWMGDSVKGALIDIDVSKAENLMECELNRRADYNAWWYMCMPISAVDKFGLPLDKLFVKEDDVEYGLRCCKDNLILVSGIAVWHENFDYKYNGYYEYFVKRNEMIVNALHPKRKGALSQCMKLIRCVGRALVEQRYFIADIIFKAYEDYFKGWEYICGINSAQLISDLAHLCPEYISKEEAQELCGVDLDKSRQDAMQARGNMFIQALSLNGYLLPRRKYRAISVTDMVKPKPVNLYKSDSVIHYNPYTATAFVTKIDKKQLLRVGGKLVKALFKLFFGYYCIRRSYRRDIKSYIARSKSEADK